MIRKLRGLGEHLATMGYTVLLARPSGMTSAAAACLSALPTHEPGRS